MIIPPSNDPDPNAGRWCLFRINDSQLFRGLYTGMQKWGEPHVFVDEATMFAIGEFFEAEGDRWEPADQRDDGLYDLWDYAIELDGFIEDVDPIRSIEGT